MKTQLLLLIVLVGFGLRIGACFVVPLDKKPWGDAAQYINLAASLADGKGYVLEEGNSWPGLPTIIRTPGWPVILSIPYRVLPVEWRWNAARVVSVGLDCINIVLMFVLAGRLGASGTTALMAGALYAVNPVTIALSAQVGCESSGIVFILLFLCSAVDRKRPVYFRYAMAGVFLGVACLVRTNWLLIAGFTELGIIWYYRHALLRAILLAGIFGIAVLAPMMPWLIRNAVQFGHFPIFGAGGGETFFGGNNDLAADPESPMWGYIVQPGSIPNEPSLTTLAERMNEVEVDRYWMGQGVKWLKTNPEKIPLLAAGKLRRAFIPMPRNSKDPLVLAASVFRALLFAAAIGGVVMMIRRRILVYGEAWLVFSAVGVATVVTTLMFCGVLRYVIGFEVLLSLPAGWFVEHLVRGWGRRKSVQ